MREGAAGDPVEVLRRIYPPLHATAVTLVGGQDAADLVQEALARVLARHPRFESIEHPLGYARAVLLHLAYRAWARPDVPVDLVALLDRDPHPGHEGSVVGDAFAGELIQRLAPRQRTCVYLRVVEDLDDAQIAAVLGCTESTVRSQLARGLASIGRSIRGEEAVDASC